MDTSTPGFKRGNHLSVFTPQEEYDEQIREAIRKHGLRYKLPKWMHKVRSSVHVLANHHLGEWPVGDHYCKLAMFQHLPLSQWLYKL